VKKIRVGLVGAGFAAALHAEAISTVPGIDAAYKTVCSRGPQREAFAKKFRIPNTAADWTGMLKDPEIDVIDITTPVAMHMPMILQALDAGKNVICEKPLSGYCGLPGDKDPVGKTVSKKKMYETVCQDAEALKEKVQKSGKLFFYAENFVYAPSVQRILQVMKSRQSHIMMIRSEEWHSGSHAAHAGRWDKTGGGVMIRMACHPLSAALYLKHESAKLHGADVGIKSVFGQAENIIAAFKEEDLKHIAARPYDVDDWAKILVTFSDGTVADISCSDFALGGTRNVVDVYTNNCVLNANMSPNNEAMGYFPDAAGMDEVYLAEKLETKQGYQYIYSNEIISRGYAGEFRDFMECAAYGREPLSGIDLAAETLTVIYAGYLANESKSPVTL
jgi:predicted dehydrogenase